jgi:hypothetical protein
MTLRSALVKWVLLGLLAVLLWPPARGFLFINEAINATVARQVLMGARLYAEVADWKGPLGYLIYAAVLAPTHFSLVALHLFALLLVGLLLLWVGLMAWRLGGPGVAFPAAALTLVFLALTLGPSLEMDLPMAALSAAGYLALVWFLVGRPPASGTTGVSPVAPADTALPPGPPPSRLLPALAGFLLVLAVSVKQVTVLDLAALALACLWLSRRYSLGSRARAALLPLALGVLAGVGVMALVIAHYSTFRDYLAWAWIIPWAGQRVGLSERLLGWSILFVQMIPAVALIWALGLVAAVRFWRDRHGATRTGAATGASKEVCAVLGVMLPLWLLAGIIGLLVGSQPLAYHMTQSAAPLGLLAALGLRGCLQTCPVGRWRRYLVAVVVVALALSLARPLRNSAWRWRDRVFASQATEVGRVVGARLASLTGPEDRIVVIAHDPSVVFWSGRRVGSRYLALEHYWNPSLEANLARSRGLLGPLADPARVLREDVRRTRPRFILVPADPPWFLEEATPQRSARLQELLRGYRLIKVDPLYREYERAGSRGLSPGANELAPAMLPSP